MKLSITATLFLICFSAFSQENETEKSTIEQPVKRVTKVEKTPLRAVPSRQAKVLAPLSPATAPVRTNQETAPAGSAKKQEEGGN